MNMRVHGNATGQAGSIPLTLLLTIVVTGLIATTFTLLNFSTRTVRQDRAWNLAIQVSEAGLTQAIQVINNTPDGYDQDLPNATYNAGADNDTINGETFAWSASYDAPNEAWQITVSSTVSGRTRTIEADAEKRGIFLIGAFADQYLALRGNNGADSYPADGRGSVGSNNTVVILNGTDPQIVVLAGDATCSETTGTGDQPCDGEANSGETYQIVASNPFDIDAIEDDIDAEMAAECGASLETRTFADSTEMFNYFGAGGTFCFNDLTIGDGSSGSPVKWTPTVETKVYVQGDLSIGRFNHLNCELCPTTDPDQYPEATNLIFNVLGDNVVIGNQSELGMALAAPNATCVGNPSNADAEIYGSVICSSLENQGGWYFHYDARLASLGADEFTVTNWREEVGGSTSHS